MNSRFSWLLGLSLAAPAFSPALAQGVDLAEVDRFVTAQMKRFDVPGVALAIVKDGKVVLTKGYGVRDTTSSVAVNADTLFAIGSVSKSFTALGVMRQVEQGALNLDTPINTYLPTLKFSDARQGAKVTLRHLLSMTSGLPRADNEWAMGRTITTRAQMLETITRIPFTHDPGTEFQYCNQNFVAAGAALEAVTKQSWEAYTKANVFAPLGMNRSVFEYSDAVKDGNVAAGYTTASDGVRNLPAFDRLVIAGPAGSIHSSANDMARYLIFQLGDGRVGSDRLLSADGMKTMHDAQVSISSDFAPLMPGQVFPAYGLGWFSSEYRGVKIVEHGGNIDGFTADAALVPQHGLGVVLLTNLNGANEFTATTRLGLTERFLNMQPRNDFASASYPRLKTALEATKTYRANPADLQALEGNYTLVTGESVRVYLDAEKLMVEVNGAGFELKPISPTKFIVDAQGTLVELEFQPAANGVVWLYQDGVVAGVRVPAPNSSVPSSPTELRDPQGRFSATLPAGQVSTQNANGFSVVEYKNPDAVFVLTSGNALTSLPASVTALLRQLDPSFNLEPTRTDVLPALNGIVWTQLLYTLPGNQTLAVLATQRGNRVYLIAVQTETRNLNAVASLLQQIASSYKIL
jgi:CubicO group peptidase (beta-lactamase class C family)